MDYSKESYVLEHDRSWWGEHPNIGILKGYKECLTDIVCDLGCNNGMCTSFIPEIAPVKKVYGIDINPAALSHARTIAASLNYDGILEYTQANLTCLPFEDAYFSCVISFHTLEHIYPDDTPQVLKEMYRCLKPGRPVIVSIPYENAHADPCHVSFYNEKSLAALFESHFFEVVEVFKDDRFVAKGLLTGLFKKPA